MRPFRVACDAVVNPNVPTSVQKTTRTATSRSAGREIRGKRDCGAPIFFAAPLLGNREPMGALFHCDLFDHGLLASFILKDIVEARRRIAIFEESKGARNTDVVDWLTRSRRLDRLAKVFDRELRRAFLRHCSNLVADCSWVSRIRLDSRQETQDTSVKRVRRQ